jgi:hypothetical protein
VTRQQELQRLVGQVHTALECLRQLTRGVFPTQLGRAGLGPSLTSYLRSGVAAGDLRLDPSMVDRRFAASVEAAVYVCCVDALAAASRPARVEISVVGRDIMATVSGVSPDDLDVQAVVDRVQAVGGDVGTDWSRGLTFRVPAG